MISQVVIDRPWRYRDPRRGAQVLQPGRYRVPDELDEKNARRAVAEGMGRALDPDPLAPPVQSLTIKSGTPAANPATKPKARKRRSARAKPAPK